MWTLPENLTLETATACVDSFRQDVVNQSDSTVVVDATVMREFDSAALAVLLEGRRSVVAAGKNFAVRNLPPRLQQLAALYGVAELLPSAG